MNELELVLPDKEGFENYLNELQPAVPLVWEYKNHVYVRDKSLDAVSVYSNGFERFKCSLRYIYDYGTSVLAGIPKLCLALKDIYDCMKYVACSGYLIPEKELGSDLEPKTCLSLYEKSLKESDTFAKIITQFGLSDTVAYNYKNLACLVDRETGDFEPLFQGYSVSLLIEMQAYLSVRYPRITKYNFEKLAGLVPKTLSIREFREYRKIMLLWSNWKEPFQYFDVRCKISEDTQVEKVLDIYNKLIQEQEQSRLKALTEQSQSKDKPDPNELVGNDVLIKQLRDQISELKMTSVPNLGKCDGCIFSGVNLNKCRCCRRYKDLKDLFQSN